MYVNRHLEVVLQKASKMFGAVLVTGPRQVGKTTLLRKFSQDAAYVTLDDPMQLHAAIEEPATFSRIMNPLCSWMRFNTRPTYFHISKCKWMLSRARACFIYLAHSNLSL